MPMPVEFFRQYFALQMPINVDKKIPNAHMPIHVYIGDNGDKI